MAIDDRGGARKPPELAPDELRWRCALEAVGFARSTDAADLDELPGQPRALAALELGVGVEREGFNIFALGRPGSGRHTLVQEALERRAAERAVPPDLCYVYNFEDEHRPRLLQLPAGRGQELRRGMEGFVRDLKSVLPAAFESAEYQSRRKGLDDELERRQREAWEAIAREAGGKGLSVVQSPMGFIFAPLRGEHVLSPDEYRALPAEERTRLETEVERLKQEVEKVLLQVPSWTRARRQQQETLDQDVARRAVAPLLAELREDFREIEALAAYFAAVEEDVVVSAQLVARSGEAGEGRVLAGAALEGGLLRRYRVNVLVDHGGGSGAPIVYEDNPTLANLVGRVEHSAQLGILVTDFTMVKPGALHRASGGYLVLDAPELLRRPFAWEALKRALRSRQARVESASEALGWSSTVTLEPEPVPLDLKVVLVGDPQLYYLLNIYDPDFTTLFKISADFADYMERSPENVALYARLVAGAVRRERLRPADAGGVARVVEHAARRAGDATRLSLRLSPMVDLLQEADHRAAAAGRLEIGHDDVQLAIDARVRRSDRLREEIEKETRRGMLLIDTDGEVVAQANGLAVVSLDRFAFGHPVRITARVRLGEGEVVNIEREVELSGPMHSKGVLILQGFLGQRYAQGLPLSLHATLVVEQSGSEIDGDSASLVELCTLLSGVGELPLRQAIAVTGSVDQHGRVQAIGGVNEKIEGFFDLCRARGLTGRQGVAIPAANRVQLMLRDDVVSAVAEGRFHVWAVSTVDEALEVLTGLPAGERGADGSYPEGSVNRRIEERLIALALLRMEFQKGKLEREESGAETPALVGAEVEG